MHAIAAVAGRSCGPMGGAVEPRSCKFCGYYGHTTQHCKKRSREADREIDREIQRDRAERKRQMRERAERAGAGAGQAEVLDAMGVRWVRDPIVGPIIALPEERGEGRVP